MAGAVLIVVMVFVAWQTRDVWFNRRFSNRLLNSAAVSISCRPETFPIEVKQGASIYGILLHPKWGDNLISPTPQTGNPSAKSVWPDLRGNNVGYQCVIVNGGAVPLIGIVLPIDVQFRDPSATVRTRVIKVPLTESLAPGNRFAFYIADDTGWDPRVVMPEHVQARLSSSERGQIPVGYASTEGEPISLNGFGVQVP